MRPQPRPVALFLGNETRGRLPWTHPLPRGGTELIAARECSVYRTTAMIGPKSALESFRPRLSEYKLDTKPSR